MKGTRRKVEATGEEICYYCGKGSPQKLTRDHIFPRLLFPKGSDFSNLPRCLPMCYSCNNGMSKDEEIFQQLVLSWRALDTPQALQVYVTKVRPNIRGLRPGLRNQILQLTQLRPLVNELGQQIGQWPVLEVPRESMEHVLWKMVKGLHCLETNTILPSDTEITVIYGGQNSNEIHRLILPDVLSKAKRKVVGSEDVLVYWRAKAGDNPIASITWFVFYRWHIFCVAVLPKYYSEAASFAPNSASVSISH